MATTVEDILQKQQYLINLAQKIEEEEDVDVKIQIAKIMAEEAAQLEKDALKFEADFLAEHPPPPKQGFEVVLTPDQTERIYMETSIELKTLWIDDPVGTTNEAMLFTHKDHIEILAMEYARKLALEKAAHEEAVRFANECIDAIENGEVTQEMLDLIEELKKDPKFLNGLLYKGPPVK